MLVTIESRSESIQADMVKIGLRVLVDEGGVGDDLERPDLVGGGLPARFTHAAQEELLAACRDADAPAAHCSRRSMDTLRSCRY